MFEMQLFKSCEWCSAKLDSLVENAQELYCCLQCEDYHKMYNIITRLLNIGKINISNMFIDKQWNNLFHLINNNNICLYKHHEDDVGFEINWLKQIEKSSTLSCLGTPKALEICQHLDTLHYFLNEITK